MYKYTQPVNNHHLWWERKNYYTKREKQLRGLAGFIVPTTVYCHQLLHAQMRPMVKPSFAMQGDIIDFASEIERTDRFNIPSATADWLELQHEEHSSDEYAYRALRLAHHLRRQIGYLSLHDLPRRNNGTQ
jgi:hypothetical protein